MAKPSLTLQPPAKNLGQKLFSILLGGEKGSGLPGYVDLMAGRGSSSGTVTPRFKTRGGSGSGQQQENPVARLKLLLVRFFLSFAL